MALDKKAILSAGLKTELVEVPEWGGEVFIRELTGEHRNRIEDMTSAKQDPRASHFIVWSVVGDDGEPLFDMKDVPEIEKLSSKAVGDLVKKIAVLSGLEVTQDEAVKN